MFQFDNGIQYWKLIKQWHDVRVILRQQRKSILIRFTLNYEYHLENGIQRMT